MFAGTSTSSTGDRMYVEIQQMWYHIKEFITQNFKARKVLYSNWNMTNVIPRKQSEAEGT